jgi:hypothetical protein
MDLHMKSCCWTHAARGKSQTVAMMHEEEVFLRNAFKFLDRPSFLVRLADTLGRPVNLAVRALPQKHQAAIHKATQVALKKGLLVVTRTLGKRKVTKTFDGSVKKSRHVGRWHTAASFGLGAAGGLFGILSLPLELPLTTAVILRSVASIADEFGMDLNDPQTQLECLYILSLGSPHSPEDDSMSSAYWTSRAAFASLANEASLFLAGKTSQEIAREIERKTAPVLVKFIAQVASRFELVVNEKLLAESVPVVGALGGATINAAFTDYFSQAARYHFGLRALESKHGRAAIESYYYTSIKAGRGSAGDTPI